MLLAIRNGLWNALATGVGAITGVVGSVLVVRSLSPEAYGVFSYYLWLAGILGTLGTLAFPGALTKITSELLGGADHDEAHALARAVTLALLGFNLLLSAALIAWMLWTPNEQRVYVLIIAALLVPNALAAIFRSTLWGREHYRGVSVTETLAALLQFALIVAMSIAHWGAPGFVAAVLAGGGVRAAGLAWIVCSPGSAGRPLGRRWPRRATWRRYLAFLLPATLALLFYVIIWERSEVFFLERLSNLEQVGFYNLAYTVYTMCLALGWALVNGFYPAISRDYGAGEWLRVREKVRQGVVLAAMYAVPLAFGGWVTLQGLFVALYGVKMLPAAPVAQILFLGLLPGVLAAVLGCMIGAVGQAWLTVYLGVVLAAVNIGLDLLLIPQLGARGAAISNTGAQLLYTLLLVALVHRRFQVVLPWRTLGSIVGLGALTTLILPQIVQHWLPGIVGLVVAIGLGGVCYAGVVWGGGYLRLLRATASSIERAAALRRPQPPTAFSDGS